MIFQLDLAQVNLEGIQGEIQLILKQV